MKFLLKAALLKCLLTGAMAQAATLVPGDVKFIRDGQDGAKNPIYVIKLSGTIAYPMDEQFREALAQMTDSKKNLWVQLNSKGGSNERGSNIIKMLQAQKSQGRHVVTLVENGDTCASMCVPIFVQGNNRLAGEGSLFMFHGSTLFNFTNVPDPLQTRLMMQFFYDAGVNSKWLQSLIDGGVFSKPGSYWISGKEMSEAQALVSTQLIPRHVTDEPWRAPVDPNIRPR